MKVTDICIVWNGKQCRAAILGCVTSNMHKEKNLLPAVPFNFVLHL